MKVHDWRHLFFGSMAVAAIIGVSGRSAASDSLRQERVVQSGTVFESPVDPNHREVFGIMLNRGESTLIEVLQIGTDVVIDVVGPDGKLVDSFDGPTGRNGIEKVSFHAQSSGRYTITVRAFDGNEPAGKFRLTVRLVRSAAETKKLRDVQARTMNQAAGWLRSRSTEFRANVLRRVARDVKVIGLGEATHGSREFNDVRLVITKDLVENRGFRVIAIEWSASRAKTLESYANGGPFPREELRSNLESIWIGSRIRAELYAWVRRWNVAHRNDRVTIVGVDAADNAPAIATLFGFLRKAYGPNIVAPWISAEKELVEANEQTVVFGDSGVDSSSRATLTEIRARLTVDGPMLEMRFGETALAAALEAAITLFEFADFNGNGGGANQSRDWYMAMRILRATRLRGPNAKAVYWAHNAHVGATSSSFKTTGRVLREALGDKYCPIAVTCGEGSFVAQIPNDREDRLATSSFLPHMTASIEDVLALVRPGRFFASWRGGKFPAAIGAQLAAPQLMHWIGGLYTPGSPVSSQYRAFRLAHDFDGVIYLPVVTPENVPTKRPIIPARRRNLAPRTTQ